MPHPKCAEGCACGNEGPGLGYRPSALALVMIWSKLFHFKLLSSPHLSFPTGRRSGVAASGVTVTSGLVSVKRMAPAGWQEFAKICKGKHGLLFLPKVIFGSDRRPKSSLRRHRWAQNKQIKSWLVWVWRVDFRSRGQMTHHDWLSCGSPRHFRGRETCWYPVSQPSLEHPSASAAEVAVSWESPF